MFIRFAAQVGPRFIVVEIINCPKPIGMKTTFTEARVAVVVVVFKGAMMKVYIGG